MQATAVGLQKVSGTSKTGSPFEMHQITILVASKNASSAKFNKLAYGYEPMTLNVAESAFPKFQQIVFPCRIDLTMDHEPRAGKVEAVVAGFTGTPLYIDLTAPGKAG